jgi:glucose-1-phosphate thymidylyltransferase
MAIRKAVIAAGGSGTRLRPLTLATNKHLLPLYDKPVIWHTVDKLVAAGISRIMIVTGPEHLDDFAHVLGSGADWKPRFEEGSQIQITYGIQNEPRGIADALWIARDYIGDEGCVLCLGDNYIEDDFSAEIRDFKSGSTIFLKNVPDPERFGIAEMKDDVVVAIEEKPKAPKSDLAVTGLYLYDNTVFDKLVGQKPSARGEYEITDINNRYAAEGTLRAVMLEKAWFDIGTFDSLLSASQYVKDHKQR